MKQVSHSIVEIKVQLANKKRKKEPIQKYLYLYTRLATLNNQKKIKKTNRNSVDNISKNKKKQNRIGNAEIELFAVY